MKHLKSIVLTTFCLLAGIILTAIIIELLLIPDPCHFHTNEPGWLVDFFYDFPTSEGGHPVWSLTYFVFVLSAGCFLGYWLKRLINAYTERADNST